MPFKNCRYSSQFRRGYLGVGVIEKKIWEKKKAMGMVLFQQGQDFALLQPKHESFQLWMQFSLVSTPSGTCARQMQWQKTLKNPSKRLWAVIICNECTLILCKLHCSATQRLSLSPALASWYLAVRNIWKSGTESTALIPFFLCTSWLLWNAHCALAAEMFAKEKKSRRLNFTLSLREKSLAEQLFALLKYVSH